MGTGPKQKAALIDEHRVILVSPAVYKEIWELLAESGYDYLVWPDNGRIVMDGFVLSVKENV